MSFGDTIKNFFQHTLSCVHLPHNMVFEPEAEKEKFLNILKSCIESIDRLELSGLNTEQNTEIQTIIKNKISGFHDEIRSQSMLELSAIRQTIRAQAGLILLSSSFFLSIHKQIRQRPNLSLNEDQRIELSEKIKNILIEPYRQFTDFEKALNAIQAPISIDAITLDDEETKEEQGPRR